jgi:hypothetical protein
MDPTWYHIDRKGLISGTFLSIILVVARIGEEEVTGAALSTPESL